MRGNDIMLIVTTILLIIMTFTLAHSSRTIRDMREQIAEHNCGQYNPQTGEFEWGGGE